MIQRSVDLDGVGDDAPLQLHERVDAGAGVRPGSDPSVNCVRRISARTDGHRGFDDRTPLPRPAWPPRIRVWAGDADDGPIVRASGRDRYADQLVVRKERPL